MEEQIMGFVIGGVAIIPLCIGLPWLIFHYVTKWKQSATLTQSDEKLLDELHDSARRLDDRLCTIERIMTAENPDWPPPRATDRPGGAPLAGGGRGGGEMTAKKCGGASPPRAAPASTATSATAS